jgi:hypothetical protein
MATSTDAQPAPTDPCPPWCRSPHGAADHPEDAHHRSRVHLVAAVAGHPTLEADERAEAVSLAVRLVRRVGSPLTWLEVLSAEGPQVRLVLTAESARHLLEAARALLGPPT